MWLDEKQIICMITSPQKPVPRKGLLEKKKKKQQTVSHSVFKSTRNKFFSYFCTLFFFPANSNKVKTKGLFKTVVSDLHSADLQVS